MRVAHLPGHTDQPERHLALRLAHTLESATSRNGTGFGRNDATLPGESNPGRESLAKTHQIAKGHGERNDIAFRDARIDR